MAGADITRPFFRMLLSFVAAVAVGASAEPTDADVGASAEPDVGAYAGYLTALGLGTDSTPLEIHLAFVNKTNSFGPEKTWDYEARKRMADAGRAFSALSDEVMREEVLDTVNYWDHVVKLGDDEELQRFTELQPGGSAALRVLFISDKAEVRMWPAFACATQLHGRVRVGQIFKGDAVDSKGAQTPFLNTLKVRQFPAAVIYDPVSRALKTSYQLDSVAAETQKFLSGQIRYTERMSRVQEFDAESLQERCSGGPGGIEDEACDWTLVLATTEDYEMKKRDDLTQTLRMFTDACRMLNDVRNLEQKHAVCFWSRFQRAPEWKEMFIQHGMTASDDYKIGAMRQDPKAFVMVPADKESSAHQLQRWFRSQITSSEDLPLANFPKLPAPMLPDDEPEEDESLKSRRHMWKRFTDLQTWIEDAFAKALTGFDKLDTEEKTMVAGAVFFALIMLGLVCKFCVCARRASVSEDQAALDATAIVQVPCNRQPGEKLGLGIGPTAQDTYTIQNINGGSLVDRWNSSQADEKRRIRDGDRIVAVTTAKGRIVGCGPMADAMKAGGDITLAISYAREFDAKAQPFQKVLGMVVLEGMSLNDAVQVRNPELSFGAKADASTVEIAKLNPALEAWNAVRQNEGKCCTQTLQEGDRIISVNSATDARSYLGLAGPTLVIARWRPTGALRSDQFEISIDRAAEERLGMQIRRLPSTQHIIVLDVVEGGAVHRMNTSGGSRPVLKGDRLISVNGKTEHAQITEELAKKAAIFRFERWIDDSSGTAAPAVMPGIPAPSATPPKPAAAPTPAGSPAPPPPTPPGDDDSGYVVALGVLMAVLALVPPDEIKNILRPELYASVAMVLLGIGGLLTLRFFWREMSGLWKADERHTAPQLFTAFLASICLGYGNWFLFTWAGVYA